MGNPHPTKSKPVKIGRKHTGQKSARAKQRQSNGAKTRQQIEDAQYRKLKAAINDYWAGRRDDYPAE
jgi:hypothetical protein